MELTGLDKAVATAILGVDTLWGGDVRNPSGTGRFIADCYFSGRPFPPCYNHPTAAKLRESGGVLGHTVTNDEIRDYLTGIEFYEAMRLMENEARSGRLHPLRSSYLENLNGSIWIMDNMALAHRNMCDDVPFEMSVIASTGQRPRLYDVSDMRCKVEGLLTQLGEDVNKHGGLWQAAQAWRQRNLITDREQFAPIGTLSAGCIETLEQQTRQNAIHHLPTSLHGVPRTNVRFLPIEGAWFSGSLNYLGTARNPNGSPQYEATYEINAALQISLHEFWHLIAHEVVPGHIMNYAIIQHLYHTGAEGYGFEHTIGVMNSMGTALAEGIANNALLFAFGLDSVFDHGIPAEMQLGMLLSLLQDYAKANIAYRLHGLHMDPDEVESMTREECLLTEERAKKLTHSWGAHPLLGRMYLPSYAVGTETVANLVREHGWGRVAPAIYGVHGPVDVVTVHDLF